MADDIAARMRRWRETNARERAVQGLGLAGASDALGRGMSLADALAMVPDRPLEEPTRDYEAEVEILGKLAEVEKEKRAYGEKIGETKAKIREQQQNFLGELIKSITDLEKTEMTSAASVRSAQLTAEGNIADKYMAAAAQGKRPEQTAFMAKAQQALLNSPALKAIAAPQGPGAPGQAPIPPADMQALLGTLTTSMADLADGAARYAVLASVDETLGLTGTPSSLVALVTNPDVGQDALAQSALGLPGNTASIDPDSLANLSILRRQYGTEIKKAEQQIAQEVASGRVATDLVKDIRRGGGASASRAQSAVQVLYSFYNSDKPLSTQDLLKVREIADGVLRGAPGTDAMAQQLAQKIDAMPTDEDAPGMARQFAIQQFGYDPDNLERLSDAYREMLDDLRKGRDPQTAYAQQRQIMASPEFEAWQRESGISDPQKAWQAMSRQFSRDTQAAIRDDRQTASSPSVMPRRAPAPAAEEDFTAAADMPGAFDLVPLDDAAAGTSPVPVPAPQAASTQRLAQSLRTIPALPDTEKQQTADLPGKTGDAYGQAVAQNKRDLLRKALMAGAPKTTS